jgi:hypothetical protein
VTIRLSCCLTIRKPTLACASRRVAKADDDLRRVAGRRRKPVLHVYYTPEPIPAIAAPSLLPRFLAVRAQASRPWPHPNREPHVGLRHGRRSAEAADHDLRRVAGRKRTLVLQVYYTLRPTANGDK